MRFLLHNPIYKWKNLVVNPNVVIRSKIQSFDKTYYEIEEMIKFLDNFIAAKKKSDRELKNNLSTINSQKSKATSKKTKKNEKIMKDLGSLMLRQKTLLEQQKKAIDNSKKFSKDVIKKISAIMDLIYDLFIAAMTLLHRERHDADMLIEKIKGLKHENAPLLEQHKEHSIRFLNEIKKEVYTISKKMYFSLKYQRSRISNPVAFFSEVNPQPVVVKCRRVRQATIEIDSYESLVQQQIMSLKINQIPHLVHDSWIPQLNSIKEMAEDHMIILSKRVHTLLHKIIKNSHLQKKYTITLNRLEHQARRLMKSISIDEYKAKKVKAAVPPKIIPFPKQKEIIKKAA